VVDYSKPVELAENIFWVGYVIPDDPFQCHVYLIKNGDESILIDPGSMITFPVVLEKITSILPLKDIKYIIMHHQDPDIVGCFSTLETLFPKAERYIITHWRTQMLLKHYQWKTPFYLIDENEWKLKAKDLELEFVFTPYAHFAGAFATYDKKSKIIFSSDLFGGLTPEFQLFAKSADEYFEYAKPFHKHYIPTKHILNYVIDRIEEKDISLVAPQHGSIIKKDIIKPLFDKLRTLNCGLYLMDDYYDNILVLNQVDDVLNSIFKEALITNSFDNLLKTFFSYIKEIIKDTKSLIIKNEKKSFVIENYEIKMCQNINLDDCKLNFKSPLFDQEEKNIGELIICYENKLTKENLQFLQLLLKNLSNIIGVALIKEITFSNLKEKEQEFYEKSITDSLTGLYNRSYLIDFLNKKIEESKRYNFPLSLAMIDIDFFKKVNDTYGHLTGDCVLRTLSIILKKHFRESDIVARYGGEEFIIVMQFAKFEDACAKMENLRKEIENYSFCDSNLEIHISGGVEEYNKKDDLYQLIEKVDNKLYISKESGRNQINCKF
jgi:diguanylate cyclase (GGDEF)-like protein